MSRTSPQWQVEQQADAHACPDDFRSVFTEHVTSLYKLSFLLTGNRDDAERCFVAALDEAIAATGVPKHSVRSRAKRAIVQEAVDVMKPLLEEQPDGGIVWGHIPDRDYLEAFSGRQTVIRRVLSLQVFERFVFVLCVLERHSVEECARLLNCDIREVLEGRTRALVSIASSGTGVNC